MIQADPTDDFSFSLAYSPDAELYSLMPESKVAAILQDRLDLFPKSQVPKLAAHLVSLCNRFRFDPVFVLSLIEVESGFRIKAVSPMGAVGLMQLMPGTAAMVARDWGLKLSSRSLTDPFLNISIGITYLAQLRDRYANESPYYLLAAYNAGPSKIDSLRERGSLRPIATKKYYHDIRSKVPWMKFYQQRAASEGARFNRSSGV